MPDSELPQSSQGTPIWSVFVAGILSFFVSGLGQFYNGQPAKGLAFFFGSLLLWFVFLGWVVATWAAIDAVVVRWGKGHGEWESK